jgi:hypothetical protein
MKVELEELEAFPPNENPYHHDLSNMGELRGKDLMLMYQNHSNEECHFLILVDMETGQRVKVSIDRSVKSLAIGIPREKKIWNA